MKKERKYYLFDLNNPENNICKSIVTELSEEQMHSDIEELLDTVDESDSLSSKVLYYLRRKKLSSKDMYERAYIDRRLLHKITKNPKYHPSKKTVFSLCVAFELNYHESIELLGLASYSFSPNSKYDTLFAYFLSKGIYDIDVINDILYEYGYPCIGD